MLNKKPYKYILKLFMYNFNSQMRGLIAQSVEQMTENHRVGGSIPPQATTPFRNPKLQV